MKIREYWTNIEIERSKPYWLEDGSDYKLIDFIQNQTNLQRCFQDAVRFAKEFCGGVKGHVLEIGAGTGWTTALLSKIDKVESVTAVDYSEYRLKSALPIVFKQLDGIKSKLNTIVGDFFDTEFKKDHFQTIIFCQSLYMFASLNKVLSRVFNILSPEGLVMVVAERITPELPICSVSNLKKKIRQFLKSRADLSGNNFYEDREYRQAIKRAGLTYQFQLLDYPIFPEIRIMAGNHFGIKNDNKLIKRRPLKR